MTVIGALWFEDIHLEGLMTDMSRTYLNCNFVQNLFPNYAEGREFFVSKPDSGANLFLYSNYPMPLVQVGDFYYYVYNNILTKAKYDMLSRSFIPYSTYPGWPNVNFITGGVVNGKVKIYLLCGGLLYEINQNPWSNWTRPDWGWPGVQAIAFIAGRIMIMNHGMLYSVQPIYNNPPQQNTFIASYNLTNWFNFQGMAAWSGCGRSMLFIMQNDVLHNVCPITLEYQVINKNYNFG